MQANLQVRGVSCEKCANVVIRFIKVLPGVIDVQFTDEFEHVIFSSSEQIPFDWLQKAVEEAGYFLTSYSLASSLTEQNLGKG